MSQIDFTEMSAKDVRTYGKDEMGVSFPVTLSKAEMIAKLKELGADSSTSPAGDAAASAGREGQRPTHVIINVAETEDSGKNYIRVIENGSPYQIMRGVDVKVPYGVYDNLKCAIEEIPILKKGSNGDKDRIVMRPRPRHSFSVIERIYAN